MVKTSKTILNSSGKSGHPCLAPDFRENTFNFSPVRIMLAVGLQFNVKPLKNSDYVIFLYLMEFFVLGSYNGKNICSVET